MNNIAIIPARSGSKGIKDKNIKILNGKPLMTYSIEAAIKSGQFTEVMVSTDSEHYSQIAVASGASVPFLRSEINSTDKASSWDMVEEVLNYYNSIGKKYDSFCLLQPTSPLRTSDDIINAYKVFYEKASYSVVSVCEADHSPVLYGKIGINGELDGFIKKNNMKSRQLLETYYRINGAIYIVNCERFIEDKYIYQKGSFAYIMPPNKSVDIDTELDFKLAEFLMKNET